MDEFYKTNVLNKSSNIQLLNLACILFYTRTRTKNVLFSRTNRKTSSLIQTHIFEKQNDKILSLVL